MLQAPLPQSFSNWHAIGAIREGIIRFAVLIRAAVLKLTRNCSMLTVPLRNHTGFQGKGRGSANDASRLSGSRCAGGFAGGDRVGRPCGPSSHRFERAPHLRELSGQEGVEQGPGRSSTRNLLAAGYFIWYITPRAKGGSVPVIYKEHQILAGGRYLPTAVATILVCIQFRRARHDHWRRQHQPGGDNFCYIISRR